MPIRCDLCCHMAMYMGRHESRVCDTGLGGKVGDTQVDNTTWHYGLTAVDTSHTSLPQHIHLYQSVFSYMGAYVSQGGRCWGWTCLEQKIERL